MVLNRASGIKQQRGVALITALLVVSIATIVATSMLSRKNLEIRRQSNLSYWTQAYQYSLGVEAWGRQVLQEDAEAGGKDALTEDWATLLPPMEVVGGKIAGSIEDLQGRFNLNNLQLSEPPDKLGENLIFRQFQRLLESAGGDPDTAYAVVDWIDGDEGQSQRGSWGAEDDHYLGEPLPYRAANQPFVSPSELLLVRGMSHEVYDRLRPAIIALPRADSRINVNTALPEVLKALDPGLILRDDELERLQNKQGEGGFDSNNSFWEEFPPINVLPNNTTQQMYESKLKNSITMKSNYFLIKINVMIGDIPLNLSSLVYRQGSKVELLQRTFGEL